MPASLKKRPKRRSGLITTVHPPTFNPLTAVYLENRLRPPGAAWSLLALSFILALRIHGADRISYGSKIWQTDDGLPNNSLLSLAQTEDGYLWVGTQDGLARFNGIDFHVISNSAAPHLTRGRIGALLAASDGSLWIGCDSNGVTHLSRGEAKGITISNGLPNLDVRCFLETPEGGMWVGTEGGLVLFMGDTAKHFSVTNGLGDNSVRALAFDARGNVCAATKRGLSTIHGDGTVSTRLFPGRWNANALRAVSTDSGGDLWVGATDGLYHLSGTNIATYNRGEGLPDRIINTICRDFQGQLWIGTYGGIARVVNGEITAIPVGEATAEDMVNTIIEDQEHNMWAGTRDGLIRFTPVRFTTYTTQSGLSGNNVMSVLEDSKGATWLGIWGGGLNRIQDGQVRAFRNTNDLARDSVLSLLETRDGTLWAGMDFELGVNVVSNDVRLALPSLVSGGPIRVLHEDAGGGIWIGTDQGLTVLQGTNKENFTTNNGLAGNRVRVICSGPDGAVWVGTDHGLSRFKEGKITNWRRAQGLLHEEVSALHFDAEGNLWIGTMAGGLNCYAGGKLSSWTSKDGLFSDEIYEVIEDNSGYLWMSCRRGLFRVGKKELWDFQTGKLDRVPTTVFGKADGLLSVQFNGVAKPAAWKDRQGRFWFASIRGVVEVDPTIPTNERPPPIVIERVTEGREVLWPTNKSTGSSSLQVVVPPGAQEIQVRYSALSLSSPEKNQFSYKLEGAGGSAWTEASPDRVARYNRLPPGTYTFRVIGCNNDGVWNEKGASLEMTVLPRFWQTWWFRILAVSAFGAVTFLAYRARVSRLRELEGLRMSIAANLHDQVGARLTKVAMITEHVSHQVPVGHLIRPGIEAISRATAEVTKSMDEVVWTINPKNDTLENLANYMFHYAEEYFQDTSVRCLLDFPPHLPEREVPTRTRHHLFMTLKEALSNVLKHSRATETHIKLEANDAALKIEVEDNGQGFELQRAQKSGDGLTNMRQRIGSLGGEVTWRTKPGEGTQLTIEMPW